MPNLVVGLVETTTLCRESTVQEMIEKDVEEQLLAGLRLGNRVAKRKAREILGKRKLAVLHQVLRDPGCATRFKLKPEQVAMIQAIPPEQVLLIKGTWEVAGTLWRQYRRMILKVMRKMAARVGIMDEQSLADLEGEATVGFLKAVRGYTKGTYRFSTYFCTAVRTEVRRYIKRTRGLSGANEKLLIAYRAIQEALTTKGEAHTFWDCVKALKLNEKQTRKLWGTLQEPCSEQELEETLANLIVDKRAGGIDYDLIEAIAVVEMSCLERDAFMAQEQLRGIFPLAHRNLKAVAEAHGVSPQAANYACERARSKLAVRLRGTFGEV